MAALSAGVDARYARNGEVQIEFEELGGAGGDPLTCWSWDWPCPGSGGQTPWSAN